MFLGQQEYDQRADTGDEIAGRRRRERGIASCSRREWHSSRVPTFFLLRFSPGRLARFSREVHIVTRETSGCRLAGVGTKRFRNREEIPRLKYAPSNKGKGIF